MVKSKNRKNVFQSLLLLAAILAMMPFSVTAAPEDETAGNADEESIQSVYEKLTPRLVEVKITVLEDRATPIYEKTSLDRHFDLYVAQRVPIRLAGLRISPEGEILIRDPLLPIKRYGSIELTDTDGNATPARLKAVLKQHAGILIEPIEPPAEPLPHAAFAPAEVKPGQILMIAQPSFIERDISLDVQRVHAATRIITQNPQLADLFWWENAIDVVLRRGRPPTAPPIILDDQAEILGVALDSALWSTKDGRDSWIGTSIMQDERLTTAILEATDDRIATRARQSVKEVEIEFRKDSDIQDRINLEKGKLYLYGMIIDDKGGILVPTDLDRDIIRQIERIVVRKNGQPVVAKYEGYFRAFGAFLIRVEGIDGAPGVVFDDGAFPRGTAFYTLSPRRQYGRRDDEVFYNRYLDVQTGYKEASYPLPMMPMRVGDLIADETGHLLGFLAPLRMEEQDEIRAETDRSYGSGLRARVYLFSEVADDIRNPDDEKFDLSVRPMSRKEERGLVWLGVEYQPMSAPLARAFKADDSTRGGARGLLVTHVYENSPAQKLNIGIGTILLSIEVPGITAEIDLAQPQRGDYDDMDFESSRYRGRMLWKSRRNYLTAVLTLIGADRRVAMKTFAGGKEQSLNFVLEKAPDDFDSADEYSADMIGLSVKKMTYEVRSALRLDANAPGVVVSKVEPGEKANIAQIEHSEIILKVNGNPVSSPNDFEEGMHAAELEGRVEFLVQTLGQSRIVEIDLQEGDL